MGRDFYFYGYAGPYFGVTIAEKRTELAIRANTNGLFVSTQMEKATVKTSYKRFDIGLTVGFGVEIEGAFSGGWIDNGPIGTFERSKNRLIMVNAGYRFQLNGKQSH